MEQLDLKTTNGEGAAAANDNAFKDSGETTTAPSIAGNGNGRQEVPDYLRVERNLVRRLNRKLKPGNRKVISIKGDDGWGHYFLVDTIHPIEDIEEFARYFRVVNCHLCNCAARYKDPDGEDICGRCLEESHGDGGAR